MKKQFDLQLEEHVDLIQKIAFDSLSGFTIGDIIEFRKKRKQDIKTYTNIVKTTYYSQFSFLYFLFKLEEEVERALFGYIDYLINEISIDNLNCDTTLSFN